MKNFRSFNLLLSFMFTFFTVTSYCDSHKNTQSDQYLIDSGYIEVDGGKLFYKKFGSGEPIIIVHGGPGISDQGYLLPQMLELTKDHTVVFYDQRGSGGSLEASIDPKYINLDQFSEDLERLRMQLGLKKITLIGHSWGGLLSMNYAINYPDNISSLVLLNSVPANYKGQKFFIDQFTEKTQSINNKIAALFDCDKFQQLNVQQINEVYRNFFSVYFSDKSKIADLTLDMNKESAVNGVKVMALMSKTSWLRPEVDLFPGLRNLKIPTLIIHGNQDVIPAYTAQEINEAVSGSEIVYLENCGHFPYIEAPEALFKYVRSFLHKNRS